MKSKLLCKFVDSEMINERVEDIKKNFNILFDRIYILADKNNMKDCMITFNTDTELNEISDKRILKQLINLHRTSRTNTLYTLNGLNEVVKAQNNGQLDSNFQVDWDDYQNSILLHGSEGLVQIETVLLSIISLK